METLRLAVGVVAVCDDRVVVVCRFHGSGGVSVRDLATGEIEEVLAERLSALSSPASTRIEIENAAALTRSNAKQWERAQIREKYVLDVLTADGSVRNNVEIAATKLGISSRTLWRWVASYREAPSISSLLGATWGMRLGANLLTAEVESQIRVAVNDLFLTRPKAPYVVVHDEVVRRCTRMGLTPPSLNAVIRRIKGLDPWIVAHRQLGREEALRRVGTKPGALRTRTPLEVVQIDHTLVDVHVVDDIYRKSIGRPWVTLAIDVGTRCVLGMHLSLEPPGTESVAACITQACLPKERWLVDHGIDTQWPIWGIPQKLHADNAKEFKTEALSKGCADWAIEMTWRPIGKPHYGGHIERLIGTLMGKVHLLPGTTQSNSVKRGSYDSEGKATLTLAELQSWLTMQITEQYHRKVHRGIGKCPLDAWRDWFELHGQSPAIPGDRDRFKLSFLPVIRRVLQREGLYFSQIRYWDNVLPTLAPVKGKVLIRYDPNDLSRIFVLDQAGKYWPIPYADIRLPPITLAEARAFLAGRKAHEKVRGQDPQVVEGVIKMRELVKLAAEKTKSARRTQQRRTESKKQALGQRGAPPASGIDFSKPAVDYTVEFWERRR